jgi:hypothetical protein
MTGTQLVRASAAAYLRGLRRALVSPGIVILGRPALRNLGKLIGGTSAEFRHVQGRTGDSALSR